MATLTSTIIKSFFKYIPVTIRKRILLELAETCKFDRLAASGKSGEILGSVSDRTIFRTYALTGDWSSATSDIIKQFFKGKGRGTFIDIGANIGLTAIPIAKTGSVKCILFEPEPENFELLSYNMIKNAPPGTFKLNNLALMDRATELEFELAAENHGDHRIRNGVPGPDSSYFKESLRKVITVRGDTLEASVEAEDIKGPLAVKIDTQGAEYHIYKGGRNILASADLLVMEFWPYGIKRMGGSPENLLNMLREDFPYVMLFEENDTLSSNKARSFEEYMPELSKLISHPKDSSWTDLVLLKYNPAE